MPKTLVRAATLAILLCAVSTALTFAKGAPPKISISGPGLDGVLQVNDWEGLGCIAPGGLFRPTDAPIAAPSVEAGYDIVRFAWTSSGSYQPFDRLHYYLSDGGGLVFYDGSSTFGTPSKGEGHWYQATPLGASAMQQLLRKLGVSLAKPLPAIALAGACSEMQALEPGERFDKATASGPGLAGEVAVVDPRSLLLIGQPLTHPFWQASWNVQPQFATRYEFTGYYKNGDAFLSGGKLLYHPHPGSGRSYLAYNGVWYAVAPDVDAALRGLLKSLGATFAPTLSASVGSVVLDAETPPIVTAQHAKLGLNVREPGGAPASDDMALIYLASEQNPSVAQVFVAKPDGAAGHYAVEISLPASGHWYFWVVWGPFNKQVEMSPLVVEKTTGSQSAGAASGSLDPIAVWPLLSIVVVAVASSLWLLWRVGQSRRAN